MGLACVKNSNQATTFLTDEQKNGIQQSWIQVLEDHDQSIEQLSARLFAQCPANQRVCGVTGQLLGFGLLHKSLVGQAVAIGQFLHVLVIDFGLNERKVTDASEQFGSKDAEHEIKHPTARCEIKMVGIFTAMFISYLSFNQKCGKDVVNAWQRFSNNVINAMHDGAYWTEDRWGVNLETHYR